MWVYSFMFRTGFSLCCCYFVLIRSSASGFTASLFEGTNNNLHVNRNEYRSSYRPPSYFLPVPHRQLYGRQGARQYQRQHQRVASAAATTSCLSLSMELPFVSEMASSYTYCLKYHYFPTQSITNAILTVVGDGIAQNQETSCQQAGNDYDYGNDNNNNLDSHTDTNTNRIANLQYDHKRGLVYFFKGLGSGIVWAWWFDMAEVWSLELTQSMMNCIRICTFQQSQEVMDFATTSTTTMLAASSDAATIDVLSIPAQTIRTLINVLSEQFLAVPVMFCLWDIPLTSLLRGSSAEQIPSHIREKLFPLLVANAKVWTPVNVVTYNIPLEYRLLFTSAASIFSESINSGITSKQIETPEASSALANSQRVFGYVDPIFETGGIDGSVLVPSANSILAIVPLRSSAMESTNSTLLDLQQPGLQVPCT